MRIAWIIYGDLNQITGGYIYDRLVVEGLRAAGDEVVVMTADSALAARDVRGFDAVVGDELCFRELGPAFRAWAAGPARVLLVHHLTRWESACDGVTRAAEQAALDAADAWIVTGDETARRLAGEEKRNPSGVHVAKPGADRLPRVQRQRAADGEVHFLFVGNFLPRKNLPLLLQAFARVDVLAARLVLLGDETCDPEQAAQLRRTAPARVRFAGPASDETLAAALADADALVLPSALEGYGMVLGEALFAGVPVIAARVGAAESLLRDSGAGLLVPPGDRDALAAALTAFARDPALRAGLRESASAPALPRWRDTVDCFRLALTRAVAAKTAGAEVRCAPDR